jgi:hypothetical protein
MRMMDVKWKPIDEDGSRCIDEDGSMSCHSYMMKVVSLVYDALLEKSIDNSLLSYHD